MKYLGGTVRAIRRRYDFVRTTAPVEDFSTSTGVPVPYRHHTPRGRRRYDHRLGCIWAGRLARSIEGVIPARPAPVQMRAARGGAFSSAGGMTTRVPHERSAGAFLRTCPREFLSKQVRKKIRC
jgi:hypothetical protein